MDEKNDELVGLVTCSVMELLSGMEAIEAFSVLGSCLWNLCESRGLPRGPVPVMLMRLWEGMDAGKGWCASISDYIPTSEPPDVTPHETN